MKPPEDHRPLHLRRHAGSDRPAAEDGPFAVERLTALSHDLSNLLDGSMRCLGLARRALDPRCAGLGGAQIDAALRQITTVHGAMERMSDLVNAAMRSSGSVVSSPALAPAHPVTLGEAAQHAADVLTPEAAEHRVSIRVNIEDPAGSAPVGPMYPVILNGVRNAVEAIIRATPHGEQGAGGLVEVRAGLRAGREAGRDEGPGAPRAAGNERFITLEILDDGVGIGSAREGDRVMEFGVTSKPEGLGLGLAIAHEVVREAGGAIQLRRRTDLGDPRRPGAVLRVVYPWPRPRGWRAIGDLGPPPGPSGGA
ncbi:MAG: HAMP domain-containing histidine kinase [Phycisphaerales bacterium]|nr:HAMP domain-containing histidine kinase [Phycisphaerales bacterium]